MFLFRDPLDFGQPVDEFTYKGAYAAVNFDRLVVESWGVFDDDIIINGKPGFDFMEDIGGFGF